MGGRSNCGRMPVGAVIPGPSAGLWVVCEANVVAELPLVHARCWCRQWHA